MNTLENTITTMGLLSKEAYNVGNFQIGAEITANNQTYKVIDYVSTASDFQALLLQDKSGKFVMAFRGTEQHSISDWLNDVSIGFKNINEQYNDAKEFLEKAIKDYGVTIDNLTLTGHSLGGILTQQVGATYGIKGYAFNPYGTDRLLSLPESPFDGITSNFLYGLLTSLAENAIAEYNNIVQKFDNSCRYEDITNMYLSTAIIHGNGYEKVKEEFTKLGVYGANDNSLHLEVITKDTDTTSIFSGSNLSVAELYALVNFNPFIVSNINSNAYDEIEKFKDEYSENYIKDKAKMFSELLGNHNGANLGTYYKDLQSGKELDLTQDFNGYYDEIVFGTNSNDNITNLGSKSGEHKLYTLAGDDTIKLTGGSNYKFINLNLLVA